MRPPEEIRLGRLQLRIRLLLPLGIRFGILLKGAGLMTTKSLGLALTEIEVHGVCPRPVKPQALQELADERRDCGVQNGEVVRGTLGQLASGAAERKLGGPSSRIEARVSPGSMDSASSIILRLQAAA